MECGSYTGIKLLEYAMKVVERIFNYGIRQQIDINDTQFGFMKGKGTTDAIFIVRQMQEKFRTNPNPAFSALMLLVGQEWHRACKKN